jgi:hypothetical protein
VIAYLPERRDSIFNETMARESINAEEAVDTTGVMAASADLDVHTNDVELADGGSAEFVARGVSRSSDRRRAAATVVSAPKRGVPPSVTAAASAPPAPATSFTISEEDDVDEGATQSVDSRI